MLLTWLLIPPLIGLDLGEVMRICIELARAGRPGPASPAKAEPAKADRQQLFPIRRRRQRAGGEALPVLYPEGSRGKGRIKGRCARPLHPFLLALMKRRAVRAAALEAPLTRSERVQAIWWG